MLHNNKFSDSFADRLPVMLRLTQKATMFETDMTVVVIPNTHFYMQLYTKKLDYFVFDCCVFKNLLLTNENKCNSDKVH